MLNIEPKIVYIFASQTKRKICLFFIPRGGKPSFSFEYH